MRWTWKRSAIFLEIELKRRGHENIFCSIVRYAFWWRRFCACMEEVEEDIGVTEVFEMGQMPFFNSCEHGRSSQDPSLKHSRPTNEVEYAICFRRIILPVNSIFVRVGYDAPCNTKLTIPDRQIWFQTSHVYCKMNAFSGLVLVHPVLRLWFLRRGKTCCW